MWSSLIFQNDQSIITVKSKTFLLFFQIIYLTCMYVRVHTLQLYHKHPLPHQSNFLASKPSYRAIKQLWFPCVVYNIDITFQNVYYLSGKFRASFNRWKLCYERAEIFDIKHNKFHYMFTFQWIKPFNSAYHFFP